MQVRFEWFKTLYDGSCNTTYNNLNASAHFKNINKIHQYCVLPYPKLELCSNKKDRLLLLQRTCRARSFPVLYRYSDDFGCNFEVNFFKD